MAKEKVASGTCPACHRRTYTAKWGQCSAADCRLNPANQGVRVGAPEVEGGFKKAGAEEGETKAAMSVELSMCREEVVRLKRQLAEANRELERLSQGGGEKVAMTPAERVRAYRERQKAGQE